MQHLAGTARGKLAKTQQDLLKIAMNESPIRTEMMEHPICATGFCEYGEDGLQRMDDQIFVRTIMTLLKSRPAARLWDIVPECPYTEDQILVQSPEGFRMSFEEKALLLRDEFMRRPTMVGFRLELHNVVGKTDRGTTAAPSLSIAIYEAGDALEGMNIPVSIKTMYRTNF